MNRNRYFYSGTRVILPVAAVALAGFAWSDRPQEHVPLSAETRESARPLSKPPGRAEKITDLIGKPVECYQGSSLGRVENFMVDTASHRVVAVVLSCGHLREKPDEWIAVSPAAIRFNTGRDALQLDTAGLTLNRIPHFRAHEWPETYQETDPGGAGPSYAVRPYFITVLPVPSATPASSSGGRSAFTIHRFN